MAKKAPRPAAQDVLKMRCDYAAAAYAFVEAHCHAEVDPRQARQRQITAWSFAAVAGVRPEVQTFTAVLLQDGPAGDEHPNQIVPDNFVVVTAKSIAAYDRYDLPFEPARPLVVFDYPSTDLQRKRSAGRLGRYQDAFAIPYVVRFDPGRKSVELHRLIGGMLVPTGTNAAGRYEIGELEVELGVLKGFVRFWFRGVLIPLPGEVLASRLGTGDPAEPPRARSVPPGEPGA